MPKASLLAGAVATGDWGVVQRSSCRVKPHRHPFGMPPPLIGAALAKRLGFTKCQAPPTSGGCRRKATGGFPHQKAPPSLKGAMGALYHITMGSAYSALEASGAFASSPFAAGSAGAAGATAGFGACFTTGLGGLGSSFSGKRMMCLGHF